MELQKRERRGQRIYVPGLCHRRPPRSKPATAALMRCCPWYAAMMMHMILGADILGVVELVSGTTTAEAPLEAVDAA
jgi:hypothetical protein